MNYEKQLIVNADDYGLTREVSGGILYAHLHGIITSTTAMMNMEGVLEDLKLAELETPELGIGVHLVLTAGSPVLPRAQVSSLVDQNGQFSKIKTIYEALKQMKPDEICQEWSAQIEKFLSSGLRPDHLDSHHHVSYLDTMLFETMLKLAQKYDLPIRKIPDQSTSGLIGSIPINLKDYQTNATVISPEYFASGFYGESAINRVLATILYELDRGTTEIMTHPGFVDDILKAKSSYNVGRKIELDILSSVEVKKLVQKLGIKLVTFKFLGKSE